MSVYPSTHRYTPNGTIRFEITFNYCLFVCSFDWIIEQWKRIFSSPCDKLCRNMTTRIIALIHTHTLIRWYFQHTDHMNHMVYLCVAIAIVFVLKYCEERWWTPFKLHLPLVCLSTAHSNGFKFRRTKQNK